MPDMNEMHALNLAYNVATITIIIAWMLLGMASGLWAIWKRKEN